MSADGVVLSLWRYPVKSMLGERCERLAVPAERCVMVDLAQFKLPHDRGVRHALAHATDAEFGVSADVLVPGPMTTGDDVVVL